MDNQGQACGLCALHGTKERPLVTISRMQMVERYRPIALPKHPRGLASRRDVARSCGRRLPHTEGVISVTSRSVQQAAYTRLLKGSLMVRMSQVYAASLAWSIQRSMAPST